MTGTSTPQSTTNNNATTSKAPSPAEQKSQPSRPATAAPISGNGSSSTDQINPHNYMQHRSSTGSSQPADSPQSMTSGTTASTSSIPSAQAHPSFDSADVFNAFASGVRPEWIQKPFGQDGAQKPQLQSQQAQNPSRQTSTSSSMPSVSPSSNSLPSDSADLQALWASFFPQSANIPAVNGTAAPGQQKQGTGVTTQFSNLGNADMSPFNMFATNGTNMNQADFGDKMAFRDNTSNNNGFQMPDQAQNQFKTGFTPAAGQEPQVFDWNNYNDDTGVNDFLASLTGSNGNYDNSFQAPDISAEDEFTAQLQKLLDQSGSGAAAALNSPSQLFGLPSQNGLAGNFGMGMGNGMGNTFSGGDGNNAGWSPSNYLNMSPFASSGSGSTTDSPSSNMHGGTASLSNSASPEPSTEAGHMQMPSYNGNGVNNGNANNFNKAMSPNTTVVQVPAADPAGSKRAVQNVFAAAKRGDVVHVVGEDGKVLKPSDVWIRMGMQHAVSHLPRLMDFA